MKRKCSLTNYAKIFSETYWGYQQSTDKCNEIGENRNLFVEEFNIKKHIDVGRANSNIDLFDHCELYKCKKGYVYISSPSIDSDYPQAEMFEKMGFSKYHNLYANTHLTYFKKFSDKVEFNHFMKESRKI